MTAEERAISVSKVVDGDRCAVCRKAISATSFWATCGWLFCSKACSDLGSDDAKAHEQRIVAAIREAEAAMKERCAKRVDYWIEHHADYAARAALERAATSIRAVE